MVCEYCQKEHAPHNWQNGICDGCNYEHKDHQWNFGSCQVCLIEHEQHEWDKGLCKICNFEASEHQWKDGVCEDCKIVHSIHQWENGACAICFLVHEHDRWVNGKCMTCQFDHNPHDWENGICMTCAMTHDTHEFIDGTCKTCGLVCEHKNLQDVYCEICGYSNYQIYVGSIQQYQLASGANIIIKTNVQSDKLKNVLIDGYPVDQQYIKTVGKEVAITGEFLNRLNVGEHDLTLVYVVGQADTTIVITEQTGESDNSNIWLYIIIGLLLVIAIVGMVFVIIYRTRQEKEEIIAEKYAKQQSHKPQNTTHQNSRPSDMPRLYTQEDEQQMMRKIENEIGVNVSRFCNENKNSDR